MLYFLWITFREYFQIEVLSKSCVLRKVLSIPLAIYLLSIHCFLSNLLSPLMDVWNHKVFFFLIFLFFILVHYGWNHFFHPFHLFFIIYVKYATNIKWSLETSFILCIVYCSYIVYCILQLYCNFLVWTYHSISIISLALIREFLKFPLIFQYHKFTFSSSSYFSFTWMHFSYFGGLVFYI